MKKIKDYIMVAKVLPDDLCDSLIKECNAKTWSKHKWSSYNKNEFVSEATKELDVMNCTQEQQDKLKPYVVQALTLYQNKNSWPGEKTKAPWLSKFSQIRFNKYSIGTMMREHYDHIHTVFDGELKGVPLISIVANLNDDYKGAEFYCRGEEIKLKKGDILLFPSNFMYPHGVRETTKGTRYSFVSWAF